MGCIGVAIEGPHTLLIGMHRRIVAGLKVVGERKIGANVVGGGRIARPRRVTVGVEGTGFGIGIAVCGIRQIDRVIGLSAQSSSVVRPVEQGVTDHERNLWLKLKKGCRES